MRATARAGDLDGAGAASPGVVAVGGHGAGSNTPGTDVGGGG